jgi:hypothetical protein
MELKQNYMVGKEQLKIARTFYNRYILQNKKGAFPLVLQQLSGNHKIFSP